VKRTVLATIGRALLVVLGARSYARHRVGCSASLSFASSKAIEITRQSLVTDTSSEPVRDRAAQGLDPL
jgi:hypothetical protein